MRDDAIVLISPDEKLAYKFGSSKVFYRRMSPMEARLLREKHTADGVIDNEAMGREGMATHVVGWEGIKSVDGKDVPFSTDLIEYLPGSVRAALTERIINGDHYSEVQKQLKN